MNAPPVQYVRTTDGYNIAFTVQGDGPLLIVLPFAFSHAQAVWTRSSATSLLQALSRRFRVVYYDGRGQGLSQRGLPPEASIESTILDLRAVLERFPEKPVLLADNYIAHTAVRFAVERPRQLRALVLMHCPVSLADQIGWVSSLAGRNWEYFLGSHAGAAFPADPNETRRLTARVEGLKQRTTQDDFLRICSIFAGSELTETLPAVVTPTLVLHIPSQGWVPQEESARTAALIPNGRLAVVGGAAFFGDAAEIVPTIESFLAESASEASSGRDGLRTILSSREIEVLRLVAAGMSNQQIARELVISLNTVNRHVSNIYAKTGAANRAEAVSYAHRNGLAG